MPIFQTRITHARLTLSPFSSDQMLGIGSVMLDTITRRIRSATNVHDSPARALNPAYAQRKLIGKARTRSYPGRSPIRDWYLRGVTLGSLKVKSASEDRVTVGFTTDESRRIVAGIYRYDQMWGTSGKDSQVLHAVILATLRQSRAIRIVKTRRAA